jgi:GNAT superfamily N-acetyltransferase
MRVEVKPLTAARWDELLELFGDRGAYSGCWCMFFRRPGADFERGSRNKGAGNRRAFKALVDSGRVPGLLAYLEGRPVGWCSVAPRPEFGRVERSPVTKPIDDTGDVWAVVCFYLDRNHRRDGIGTELLAAAVDHAAANGARVIEGYPVDVKSGRKPGSELYHGTATMFRRAGFEEVARRSPTRPLMRLRIAAPSTVR